MGTTFNEVPEDELPPPKALLRDPAQLARELTDLPDAAGNNRRLVERCNGFELLPEWPVFPGFACPGGRRPAAYLRRLCEAGLRRRYGAIPPEAAETRLAKELRLIEKLGFAEYFLVVWDIVRHARRAGEPVAGRGSGASSIVAYCLGITNVCPIACDVPFERFLHEGREDFPDLDVDFCWRTRDKVIDYAFRRWGPQRVAMVSTHNTFQARSAMRETAKAFGFSEDQISPRNVAQASRLCEAVVMRPTITGETPVVQEGRQEDPRLERIAALSRRLIGLPHLLSVHPGGVVITPGPIDRHAPIQTAAKGVRITQYDKRGVEDLKLVKLDLLGNRNLSTVHAACELVRRRHGRRIDIESLPPDDPATIALLRKPDTVGCNQLESPAMRNLLRMMQPAEVRDLMKVLALIRPGAASIGMKEAFIRRHRGLETTPRQHPQVDAILAGTCGIMTYEDDVMLVAAALLDCPLAEADRFRKAVQKCPDDDARRRLSEEFLRRCRAHGVEADYAASLWVQMAKFNAYSFCRAHAASYALLSYAGAYLKAHWPLEFWVSALCNNQSMYPRRVYVECAKRDGVRFLPVDVNRSAAEFVVDGDAIRVGLGFVDGLGPVAVEAVLAERQRRAFDGLSDFLARTGLGEAETRNLVLCGAFDSFGRSRPTLMIELNLSLRRRFGRGVRGGALLPAAPDIPPVPRDYDERRKYFDERRITGLSTGPHVLTWFAGALADRTDCDSRRLADRVGRRVRIAGVLEARRTTRTEAGKDMMFLTMDDLAGLFEVTVFPDVFPRVRRAVSSYGPYVVTGTVEDQYGAVTVRAESIETLDEAADAGLAAEPVELYAR